VLERILPSPTPVPEAGFVEGLLHEVADAGQAGLALIKISSKVLPLRGFNAESIRCGGHLIGLRKKVFPLAFFNQRAGCKSVTAQGPAVKSGCRVPAIVSEKIQRAPGDFTCRDAKRIGL